MKYTGNNAVKGGTGKSLSGKRKRIKFFAGLAIGLAAGLLLLGLVNFIPAFYLKTPGMSVLEGKWVNVYYETEREAAEDVFQYADAQTEWIAKKLGFSEKQNVNIYIYDSQSTMQRKKYGLIGPLLGLDWYIGDNIGTNVILTSPANPGKVHDYDNNKYAVLHEIVHAYISVMNPDIHLWLTEGTALYLSNGEEFYKDYLNETAIPAYKDTCTRNPIAFSDFGGYLFSGTYIEFIDATYGWDKVLKLIATEDYEECFGKSGEELYGEWVLFIENYYQ